MVWETWVQSQVASYQRLLKCYLIPPCLTLSNIRYVSRVKWTNPGKGVAPSPTPRCRSYWKGSLRVALNNGRQLYLLLLTLSFKQLRCRLSPRHPLIKSIWWLSVYCPSTSSKFFSHFFTSFTYCLFIVRCVHILFLGTRVFILFNSVIMYISNFSMFVNELSFRLFSVIRIYGYTDADIGPCSVRTRLKSFPTSKQSNTKFRATIHIFTLLHEDNHSDTVNYVRSFIFLPKTITYF